ncbi:Slam-dependent surface lipoprotein [Kingella negevensis]|uniref:Slam-dependent surface lipoprotein n=2 Tax=Kingella negevensis TaxID=1522312 RepID=UPI0025431190|nr:Slam-dependent surface lipoprotein [Kingella negevensis]MDK4689145.1 Slam-dependent surface lipoprotein [Kingella negevensis]WII90726.1 Slam-dependent surface lipoprotein [Kingella negevensis]
MMKVAHSVLFILAAAVLSACGGGGGSNSGPDLGLNNNTNPNNQNNTPVIVDSNNGKNNNTGITLAANRDQTLYSMTHSWKMMPPAATQATEVQKAVENTNKIRQDLGLSALKYDARLSAYAQRRAEEIVQLFEHQRLSSGQAIGSGVAVVNRKQGAVWGENIAMGQTTADIVVTDWKNSKGHYANMINKDYTKIGLGLVYLPNSQKKYYWVQIFGSDNASSDYYFDSSIAETNNQKPLTSLVVDGVSIPLNVEAGKWKEIHTDSHSGVVSGYAYTRFGSLKHNEVNRYQTFYQGTPTNNMPQTGSAKYVGQGVVVDGQALNTQVAAQFDVNFKNKSLTGSLSNNGKTVVNLQANITGNTFHSDAAATVETHGGFFGDNAVELAGDFREQKANGKIGAFGAKKQP